MFKSPHWPSSPKVRRPTALLSRRKFIRVTLVLIATVIGSTAEVRAQPQPAPLVRVHAHNDYEHARPLFDALDHGFMSVEVDVFLINNQLLVGHDPTQLRPDRTL